jgi:AraC-like DNA-binding protein
MKNFKINVWFTIVILLIGNNLFAQKSTATNENNSVISKYSYFENEIRNNKTKPEDAIKYAQLWIQKALQEQNWKQAVNAYKTIMHLDQRKKTIIYADTLLQVAKKTKDDATIGSVYLTIGIIHYEKKQIKKALDYYLIADQYIARTGNEYEQHKIKYAIAQTKYYLGFYEEAIALLKDCLFYFEDENDRGYLNTIHSLGLCYNKLGKYTITSSYNQLGLTESIELENEDMVIYFRQSEAINDFYKKEYEESIKELKDVLPLFSARKDTTNTTNIYYYLGKNYWEQKEQKEAIPYFLKVDQTLSLRDFIKPELRGTYEALIAWYKNQNDLKEQLKYINKLIEVDEVLTRNYKYLSQRLFKEYDTKKLKEEKAAVVEAMKNKSRMHYLLLGSLGIALIVLAILHYRNKKVFELRFKELMENNTINRNKNNNNKTVLDINPEIVTMVLQNLDKFEKNKKFLAKDINLFKLAALLNTNTKYVSNIIAKYKGKGTIDYITDLKLEYIIELLKTDKKYRNYTNQALAEEAGFGSTQNFTKAFKSRTAISPTYFIQKLNQQEIEK